MLHDKQIKDFIRRKAGKIINIEKLAGDASNREYFRITGINKSTVLCIDPQFIGQAAERYPSCVIYNLFRQQNIPIPEIFSSDNKSGLFLMEDCGNDLLESVWPTLSNSRLQSIFKELIEYMLRIQTIIGDEKKIPFTLSFNAEKLISELNFFLEHTMAHFSRPKLGNKAMCELRKEFQEICRILDKPEYFVLNHRDFHSRNILLSPSGIFLIDYQDARMGLPQYDAVSLLRDSYLVLEHSLFEEFRELHFNGLQMAGYDRMSRDTYLYYFDVMAFQRNIKAMGTFGYQITVKRNQLYKKYIAPTLKYLDRYIKRRPELKKAGEIILNHIRIGK